MWHVRSSQQVGVKVPKFTIPRTKTEFQKLTIEQKTVLLEQYPSTYARLSKPLLPWEKE